VGRQLSPTPAALPLTRRFNSDCQLKRLPARRRLPGDGQQPYAVYVDESDAVWVSN
jgi:streptogramin lyase